MSNPQNVVESSTSNTRTITPFELLDSITEKNNALRAFGALLSTADLSNFGSGQYEKGSPGAFEAEDRQWGLSKLIDLCIADQEQAIENFADEYQGSDAHLIESASSLIKSFEEGMWNPGHIPMDLFSKALEGLETVIGRNATLRPIAKALKASIMKSLPLKAVQNSDQGGAS